MRHAIQITSPFLAARRQSRGFFALALCLLLALSGCGGQMEGGAPSGATDSAGAPESASAASPNAELVANTKATGATGVAPAQGATAQLVQAASSIPRKIIYNATVSLVTENFSDSQRKLLSLIQKHQGYLAETDIGGTPGTPREGTWKIRVPESQFSAFMAEVVKLGELQTTQTNSQDVTAEFYDLQARISNKQVEERRLLAHLQRSTAKLSDILQIEREISRVRGEIEQMQGRLRLLANMTAFTTITVSLNEVKEYTPPESTTFGSQVGRSFQGSLTALADVGKGLVIVLVALAPWAIIAALVAFPLWRVLRRFTPKS